MHVVKQVRDEYTATWLRVANEQLAEHCPPVLGLDEAPGTYSYEWVNGRPPKDYEEYQDALERVWNVELTPYEAKVMGSRVIDLDQYCDRFKWHAASRCIVRCLRLLPDTAFTPVAMVHGDPTFSNVIIEYGTNRTVLIDPGHSRGLCCKELDQSKVLQSYDGFEWLYRRIRRAHHTGPGFSPDRVHWLLLATHYIRLMKHVQDVESLVFAQERVRQIVNLYT